MIVGEMTSPCWLRVTVNTQCSSVTSIATTSGKMAMRVNEDKTEDKKIAVQVYGKTLSQVSYFVYLGGVMSNNDMYSQDIRRRIGIAYRAIQKLKKFWESKEISARTKVKVYASLVLSVVLYNSETCTSTNENMQRLKVFEMACLRRIACVSRRQHIRNIDIKEQLGVMTDLQHRLQIRRLRYSDMSSALDKEGTHTLLYMVGWMV